MAEISFVSMTTPPFSYNLFCFNGFILPLNFIHLWMSLKNMGAHSFAIKKSRFQDFPKTKKVVFIIQEWWIMLTVRNHGTRWLGCMSYIIHTNNISTTDALSACVLYVWQHVRALRPNVRLRLPQLSCRSLSKASQAVYIFFLAVKS